MGLLHIRARMCLNLKILLGKWFLKATSDQKDLSLFQPKSRGSGQFWPRNSIAEPPLLWVAPAPDGQGPRAESGSDLLGSAPVPGKKKTAPAPLTKNFHFKLSKVYFGPFLPV